MVLGFRAEGASEPNISAVAQKAAQVRDGQT